MRRVAAAVVIASIATLLPGAALGQQASDELQVRISDSSFDPRQMTFEAGRAVRWVNQGTLTHTVTADDLSFDSSALRPGESFTVRFPSTGSFAYFCQFHGDRGGAGMAGALQVEQGPSVAIDPVARVSGPEPGDRVTTAVAISKDSFPQGGATAAVLARSDAFADALAGTPLAIAKDGPLLLTARDALDQRTRWELERVLPKGRTLYVLGGDAAIGAGVRQALAQLGWQVTRFAGANRAATAVEICDKGLGAKGSAVLVDGTTFADALAGGAAAARSEACVLLSNGSTAAPETAAYLADHGGSRYALGGPAAAAHPDAERIVGADRFDTAARAAARFFTQPPAAGVASGISFADGLAGGASAARRGAPLLLATRDGLPAATRQYLKDRSESINRGWVYGGTAALSDAVVSCTRTSMSGGDC